MIERINCMFWYGGDCSHPGMKKFFGGGKPCILVEGFASACHKQIEHECLLSTPPPDDDDDDDELNNSEDLQEALKFVYNLVPDSFFHIPKGLDPTFYQTGSYSADEIIKDKLRSIKRLL